MSVTCRFQSILVADDGSPENQHAVDTAMAMAVCCQARVVLLGVIEPPTAEQQAEGFGLEERGKEAADLRLRIDQSVTAAQARGIRVTGEISDGDPEKEIARFAEEHAIDLLVLGHRDISRPRRWLEGSVAEDLAKSLRVSILLVHG